MVRIGLQTAQGLAAAHAQGLIHRDIKPANLLLENGLARVKITDFGLARTVDDVGGLTQDGVVAGTPEYMAPEQARGELVDHRADLFSLGSVLYAMGAGVPPFRGASPLAVLRRINDEAPVPLRALNPDVPPWLEALVACLLAKDPDDRIQSAALVAELLEGYLAHLRQPATVPAPVLESRQPRQSFLLSFSRSSSLLICLVLTLLGLGALGFAFLPPGLWAQAQPQRPAVKAESPPVERMEVWSVVVSQDGKVLAAGAGMWDQPGEIGVWDLATRKPLQRFAENLGVGSVALSPDGKLLASGSWTGHVRLRDWAAGTELADFEVPGVARVAFSPNGDLLATVTESKTAQLWDVRQRKLLADLEGDLFRFHCVIFSPDGKRVLAGGGDWKPAGINQVTIWDVASQKQVQTLLGHQNAVICITFSPDGKTIATGGVDKTIRLWDADSGQQLKAWYGHTHWVESLVFTADGKTLVSGSHDHTIRYWDVDQGREREKERITMPADVRVVLFTPDGKTLIGGGAQKTLTFFDAATHAEVADLWHGNNARKTDMDELPVATAQPVPERKSLTRLWAIGLAIPLALGVWFYLYRRRRARQLSLPPTPSTRERESSAGQERQAPPAAVAASLAVQCAGCGKNLKARADLAGKNVKCPHCGQAVFVPAIKAKAP